MNWLDIQDIVDTLVDTYPDIDPLTLRFTQLQDMVVALPDFNAGDTHCNEKILERIQMIWLDERRA